MPIVLALLLCSFLQAATWKEVMDEPLSTQIDAGFEIRAYSEYMPTPRMGYRPYETRLLHDKKLTHSNLNSQFALS